MRVFYQKILREDAANENKISFKSYPVGISTAPFLIELFIPEWNMFTKFQVTEYSIGLRRALTASHSVTIYFLYIVILFMGGRSYQFSQ